MPLFSDKPHAAFQTTQLCDQRPLKTTKKVQSRAKRGVPKKKPTSFNSFLCYIISSAGLSVVRAPKETKRARPLLLLLVRKGSARANVLPANFFFQPNWAVISTVSAGHGRQRRWASVRAPVATTSRAAVFASAIVANKKPYVFALSNPDLNYVLSRHAFHAFLATCVRRVANSHLASV